MSFPFVENSLSAIECVKCQRARTSLQRPAEPPPPGPALGYGEASCRQSPCVGFLSVRHPVSSRMGRTKDSRKGLSTSACLLHPQGEKSWPGAPVESSSRVVALQKPHSPSLSVRCGTRAASVSQHSSFLHGWWWGVCLCVCVCVCRCLPSAILLRQTLVKERMAFVVR